MTMKLGSVQVIHTLLVCLSLYRIPSGAGRELPLQSVHVAAPSPAYQTVPHQVKHPGEDAHYLGDGIFPKKHHARLGRDYEHRGYNALSPLLYPEVSSPSMLPTKYLTPAYIVVVDAGSTGTRAHVYSLSWRNSRGRSEGPPQVPTLLKVDKVGKKIVLPRPLASLHPGEIELTMSSFFAAVQDRIPFKEQHRTPILVWGTAGMRVLTADQRASLYDAVFDLLKLNFPFIVNREYGVRTISGQEEGTFGWIAANYLKGIWELTAVSQSAILAPTIGSLDLGGGSMQVVVLPRRSHNLASGTADTDASGGPTTMEELEDALYVRSYLGVGAALLEKRVKENLMSDSPSSKTLVYPCGFRGSEVQHTQNYLLLGSGDFHGCYRVVVQTLEEIQREAGVNLTLGDPDVADTKFLGMSLFFHLTHFLSIAFPSMPFPSPTLEEIREKTSLLCGMPWQDVQAALDGKDPNTPSKRLKGRCFDGVTVVALLSGMSGVGLGLSETERVVEFVEDIKGSEVTPLAGGTDTKRPQVLSGRSNRLLSEVALLQVEWTLGAAISSLQGPILKLMRSGVHTGAQSKRLGDFPFRQYRFSSPRASRYPTAACDFAQMSADS
eukprot:scaffold154_cov373-Prasinococcus_capsulatus_cf.AAC.19